MPINFSNTNLVWASVLVETLSRLGLETAVICPGSRSAPLAVAFAQHPQIEAIPVLDERSAAFFALGIAQQTGKPAALVCTSGTAGANFYPAVIEAKVSQIPLLVLTADRPPELRDCNAGQAIDQQKLYGTYPNWYSELAIPSLDRSLLNYLRQILIYAWERTMYPTCGCVHLNLPFRDPLAPVLDPAAQTFAAQFNEADFFGSVGSSPSYLPPVDLSLPSSWFETNRGILIAGVAQSRSPQAYCQAIAALAKTLQFPVLVEGLSPLRNHAGLNPNLISTYDLVLRNADLAEKLAPDLVIRVGEMPTSKELRQWLQQIQPKQWVVAPDDRNLDPLHGHTTHLRAAIEQVAVNLPPPPLRENPYLDLWCKTEQQVRRSLDQTLNSLKILFEGKVAWLLSQHLPPKTPIFIANSTAVRDVEWFWKPNDLKIQPFFNRGANGIDGTLSTALGVAHRQQSSVLLTGDLALLHDTNGFLLREKFRGHLTIVVINNQGGGIFELLPIAKFDPPFEEFFATPQTVDFAQLCKTYGVAHELIQSWEVLGQRLNPLPEQGIRILEVQCDRKLAASWRKEHLETFG
ncbi:MAG: 2-succinyl-5-enolpyruvyl-6-hydroxy-3-cyclohexene-1-carboxylic-acid synthase [Elainellaceae cyanobacterium]